MGKPPSVADYGMMKPGALELVASEQEVLSARELARLSEAADKEVFADVASIKFIPPRIGGKGFGKFVVRYKTPIHIYAGASKPRKKRVA